MRKVVYITVSFSVLFLAAAQAGAVDHSGFDELTRLMDSGLVVEADVFSPKTWEKAAKLYQKAQQAVESNKKQSSVDKAVTKAREYVENAIKTTEVAKLSLKDYLEPREKAKEANAPVLVPELYDKAEQQFIKATRKVESGDVKGALKEAEKSTPLFDVAEMEAIRVEILGTADKLIEKALADEAGKFALATLDKARSARDRANTILSRDRYNREESVAEAKRAEYEARHASNIALSVRSLKRNDQAWEKLMLLYEIQMNRVGEAMGLDYLPFDNGPLDAANTLIEHINSLKTENEQLKKNAATLVDAVTTQLQQTLDRLGEPIEDDDPIKLAQVVDRSVFTLLSDRDDLARQLEESCTKLAELSQAHEQTSTELAARLEREKKFKKAKSLLNPSEGEVFYNATNDLVLRLTGLSFDVGKAEIKDEHVPLLEKVKQIIEMFPGAHLVIEGHTDASGDPATNLQLSEKRAFAVMQYLRQSLMIPTDKIQSIGYGADKPIASNQTPEGRAKNRRIDILVMR
jgi:outer membrane protein OmpA-like peptidoglycan-associated protein